MWIDAKDCWKYQQSMTSTSSLEGRVTRAERQNVLLGAYGFQCRCDACALDDALVEKEDQLRKEVTYSPRLALIDVGQKPTMYRPGSWPSQSVVGNLNFWQGLNVSFRSGFNSSLRFSKIFYVKKEVVQTWNYCVSWDQVKDLVHLKTETCRSQNTSDAKQ